MARRSVQLSTRITEDEKTALDQISEREGFGISTLIFLAVRNYIKNYNKKLREEENEQKINR